MEIGVGMKRLEVGVVAEFGPRKTSGMTFGQVMKGVVAFVELHVDEGSEEEDGRIIWSET